MRRRLARAGGRAHKALASFDTGGDCRAGRIVGLAFLLLAAGSASHADTENDARLWLAAIGQGSFGHLRPEAEKWRWWLEGQARFRDDMGTFDQALPRVGIGYTVLPKTTVWLGYGWFRTSPADGSDFDEHRIWQQLTWSHAFDKASFASRTRFEQRFLDTGDEVGGRFRQWFKLTVPIWRRLSLAATEEVFVNFNDTDWGARSGFDQNRVFVGPGVDLDRDRHWRVEVGYLNQFIDGAGGDNSLNHILSLNLLVSY